MISEPPKVLTLINNDRITMPEQVSLLFEVEDLAVASPATVSRAGMVYNDYKDLGWRPLVNSWLDNYKEQPEFVEQVFWLLRHTGNVKKNCSLTKTATESLAVPLKLIRTVA